MNYFYDSETTKAACEPRLNEFKFDECECKTCLENRTDDPMDIRREAWLTVGDTSYWAHNVGFDIRFIDMNRETFDFEDKQQLVACLRAALEHITREQDNVFVVGANYCFNGIQALEALNE